MNQSVARLPRRKSVLAVICTMLLLYFVMSPLMVARALLFVPQKYSSEKYNIPSVLGIPREDVRFSTVAGKCLHGWYFIRPGSRYVLIIDHPQGGNIATHVGLAATGLLTGSSVLLYDYEGFGKSEGEPSTQALLDDGLAAYDFIAKTKLVPANKIVEMGVSLGTGVASYVTAHRKCAALILISPYASLRQASRDHLPWLNLYPDFAFPQPDLSQDEMIKTNISMPLLIVHGEKDNLVPMKNAQQIFNAARCPKKLVIDPSTHHGDYKLTFLSQTILTFLASLK